MLKSRIVLAWLASAAAVLALSSANAAERPSSKPSLAEPSLSPDGREIAFVSGGDIWTVAAEGGQAHLLVSNQATESRPLYSPKGDQLAFTSTRDGAANIYVLTLASGEIRRMTWSDVGEQLDGWSADGRFLYFTSAAADVARQGDIFRVPLAGGTPMAVSDEPFLAEFTSAPSPDGRSVALMAKGMANVQWWRNGHSHIDETELWIKPVAGRTGYKRLLAGGAKHLWPMWAADGRSLFYMSDESGAENLWQVGADGGSPHKLTGFSNGRVLYPSIAANGKAIVFERGFEIWKYDIAAGRAATVPITLRGAPAGPGERRVTETRFRELALSPDGKKLAVLARGAVFAASAKDGGSGQKVSRDGDIASGVVWTPDSNRLVYAAQTGLDSNLVLYDFNTAKAQALTTGAGYASAPAISPDGKMIAYRKGSNELRVMTLNTNGTVAKDVVLFNEMREAGDAATPVWSPDSQWVAFGVTDRRSFRNVWVAPAAGGAARPISFLANGETASQIAWSPDGKFLVFDTAQRSEDTHLVRVDLVPHLPKYREDEFNELFKPSPTPDKEGPKPAPTSKPEPAAKPAAAAEDEPKADKTDSAASDAKPAAKKKPDPVVIDFAGIRTRATFIPVGLSADQPLISPDGKTLVFRADIGGRQNLFSYDLSELRKEPATPQQLTTTQGMKSFAAFAPDSKSVYLLDGGAINSTPLETPRAKAISVEGELTVDFDAEKVAVFDQAWDILHRVFFDPKFNGQDWPALRARYAPYIEGVRTADEMRRDINLMIGELNASHSGINPPAGGVPQRVADLGVAFDREAYEAGRGLIVATVVSLGPADLTREIRTGTRLLAVNGKRIEATTNLSELLLDQAGKRVVLQVADGAGAPREVVIKPVSSGAAAGLRYRDWVEGRRAYVAKVSNGRLGYVHLADMSSDSLNQLYLDLDAENQGRDGVVIDIRNNNGGFINGYVLDVFSRKNFLLMTPRDLYALPSRQALGQRALGLPTVLVINESSLSDAEDFTEGYRALGLGKVVGVPTSGWIIYTGGQRLIDGSNVRTPTVRIQDAKGGDMEMHPRPVDVTVERPLGDAAQGRDAQLDTAVAELLKGLPAKR